MASSEGMSFFSFLMMWHSFWRRVKVSLSTSLQNGFRNVLSECWKRTSRKIDKNWCRYVIIQRCPTWYLKGPCNALFWILSLLKRSCDPIYYILIYIDTKKTFIFDLTQSILNIQEKQQSLRPSTEVPLVVLFRCADLWYHSMTVFWPREELESLFDLGLDGEMGLSFAAFEKLLIRFVQVRSVQSMNTLIHYDWFALSTGHEVDAPVLPCAKKGGWTHRNWSISCVFVNAVFSCHHQVVRPTTMTQNLTVSSGEVTSPAASLLCFQAMRRRSPDLTPKSHFTSLGRWSGSSRSMRFWKSLQVIVDVDVDERGWIERWQLIPLQLLSRCPHNPQAHRQRQRSNVFSVEPKMMPLVGSQSLAMLGNLDFRIARSFPPLSNFFRKICGGDVPVGFEAGSMFLRDYQPEWDVKCLMLGYFLIAQRCPTAFKGLRASYVSIFYWSRIGSESRLEHIDLKKSPKLIYEVCWNMLQVSLSKFEPTGGLAASRRPQIAG